MVMYLGKLVEVATTEEIYTRPRHPYTAALISARPDVDREPGTRRQVLQGQVPDPANPPDGCRFHIRCPFVVDICRTAPPEPVVTDGGESWVVCHRADERNLSTTYNPSRS